MILVDIYVPAVDQTYDFNLDETVVISSLLDEIGEIIMQLMQKGEIEAFAGGELVLCSKQQNRILPGHMSLQQCGIKDGDCLFVV